MGKVHELKTWIEFFVHIKNGNKTFEIRKNDRDFQVGDTVILEEYDHENKVYCGQSFVGEITYVTDFMQAQDYVVFGFKKYRKQSLEGR